MLSPRRLKDVVERLNAIPHVKIIRIHTRIPVVDPESITPELISAFKGRAPVYVLLHCNHAHELTPAARAACARLIDSGIPMLSQSVLLCGINDSTEALANLMRAFVETRITPHYLHHGDLVRGTSHFRLSLQRAQELVGSLRGHVSGLCQPHYMLDIPGGHGKSPVGPNYATRLNDAWIVKDYRGQQHIYKDSISVPENHRHGFDLKEPELPFPPKRSYSLFWMLPFLLIAGVLIIIGFAVRNEMLTSRIQAEWLTWYGQHITFSMTRRQSQHALSRFRPLQSAAGL